MHLLLRPERRQMSQREDPVEMHLPNSHCLLGSKPPLLNISVPWFQKLLKNNFLTNQSLFDRIKAQKLYDSAVLEVALFMSIMSAQMAR